LSCSWPGRIAPGVYAQPVIQLDLTATALTAAGIDAAAERKLEGLTCCLTSPATNRAHRMTLSTGVSASRWRSARASSNSYVTTPTPTRSTGARNQPTSKGKLYDVVADPHEDHDLAATMPEKVKELQAKWNAWNAGNVKPLWGGQHLDNDGDEPGAGERKAGKRAKKNAGAQP
jgi:arylsulfatase A-like enzyme